MMHIGIIIEYIKYTYTENLQILHNMLLILYNEIATGTNSSPEDILKFITRAIVILKKLKTNHIKIK